MINAGWSGLIPGRSLGGKQAGFKRLVLVVKNGVVVIGFRSSSPAVLMVGVNGHLNNGDRR